MTSTTAHVCILPHLNAAKGDFNLVHCEFLKVIIRTVATDVVDCVHVKKCALNIWVVKIIKETVASSMMTIPTNTVMSPHAPQIINQ